MNPHLPRRGRQLKVSIPLTPFISMVSTVEKNGLSLLTDLLIEAPLRWPGNPHKGVDLLIIIERLFQLKPKTANKII